jgi:hypothetical protein
MTIKIVDQSAYDTDRPATIWLRLSEFWYQVLLRSR